MNFIGRIDFREHFAIAHQEAVAPILFVDNPASGILYVQMEASKVPKAV